MESMSRCVYNARVSFSVSIFWGGSSCSTINREICCLLYDRTSPTCSVNECRKILFTSKGRSLEGIPPTSDALLMHFKRAIYQASYCWSQSLIAQQDLPDPTRWGWNNTENEYAISWMTQPEASMVCRELIRCGCNREKGCKSRCKCVRANLKCTALCQYSGDCER